VKFPQPAPPRWDGPAPYRWNGSGYVFGIPAPSGDLDRTEAVMRTAVAVALRITGCLAFTPLGALAIIFTVIPSVIWAALRAVVKGPDEGATDRILLNPAISRAIDLPFALFTLARKIQSGGPQ
jgi:hypothetical protein